MNIRGALVAALVSASAAQAAPFTLTFSNYSSDARYGWSQGLITFQPLIAVGLTPRPGTKEYFTYSYMTSRCNLVDTFCAGNCVDDGNAQVLAQRWGLTLGVDAFLVPPVPALGGSVTVTIDAPPGARLSYVARGGNTQSVFDDMVSIRTWADPAQLSVPLYDASGQPLNPVRFELGGYDVNSTNPTSGYGGGNSGSCNPSCPTPSSGCYVAQGSFSSSVSGILPGPPPSPVARLVALSGNGRNTLTWSKVGSHYGVVVVRATNTPVTAAPANGTSPAVGTVLSAGNTVVFNSYDPAGPNSFVDTWGSPVNGTRYHYKVYARNVQDQYASGNVPVPGGLWSIPTSGSLPSPRWCYSFGFPSTMQPVLALTSGIFSASNSGGITGLNPDGSELFRPVQFAAPIQGRFLALPLAGRSGTFLIAGDQAGNLSVVDALTGSVVWSRKIATAIQAQPSTQLYSASNAAFQAANPGRDLILVASRNSTTDNTVTALSSVDGSVVWQYAPGNLDIISGGMLLDRTNNRLWVASRGSPSVRVLSTLNGALVASFSNAGPIDLPISWGYTYGEAIVTNTSGNIFAYSLDTLALSWSYAPGIQTSYAFPTGDGFIASLASGVVQRYGVNPTTKAVSAMWSPGAAIPSPTGIRIDYATQKALVGNNSGVLHQLDVATGTIERTLTVASGVALGTPQLDATLTPARLYVSTLDGRVCSYDVPF